jgi:hypothetical protein
MNRSRILHLTVAALATVALGVTLSPSSTAAPPKKLFTSSLSVDGATPPAQLQPGDYDFAFTITNSEKSPQAFGSVEILVPNGFTIGESIELAAPTGSTMTSAVDLSTNGLGTGPVLLTSTGPTGTGVPAGSSVTVSFHVTTPSAAQCATTWTILVKQSNDFSGSGNDFAGPSIATPLAGGDHLAWTTQPSNMQYDVAMSPAPVVAILDACDRAVSRAGVQITVADTAGRHGDITASTTAAGTVTLSSLTFSTHGFDDTFVATAEAGSDVAGCGGEPGCESGGFHVYQLMVSCEVNKTCAGSVSDDTTTTASFKVAAGDQKDTLVADVLSGEPENATCLSTSGRTQDYGATIEFDIATRGKVVTMTLLREYVNEISNNGTPFMDICLSIPESAPAFIDKFGNSTHDGLLQDCALTTPLNDPPCINSRAKRAGNEIITFTLDPGDPKTSWY